MKDWQRALNLDWKARLWLWWQGTPIGRLKWWIQERRYFGRHEQHDKTAMLWSTGEQQPREALWKLTKTLLTYAVCEDGTCGDCDFLRQIAWETLRIKALLVKKTPAVAHILSSGEREGIPNNEY